MGIKDLVNKVFGGDDENYEEEVLEENDHQEEPEIKKNFVKLENKDENKKKIRMSRFSNRSEGSGGMSEVVSIIRPKKFNEAQLIAESIKEKKVVTFSLKSLGFEEGQKVVDYVSGAAFAMDAHLSKITEDVLTCIPNRYEIEDFDVMGEDKL